MLFFVWVLYSVFSFVKRIFLPSKHVQAPAPETDKSSPKARKMVILTGWKLSLLRWIGYIPIVGEISVLFLSL